MEKLIIFIVLGGVIWFVRHTLTAQKRDELLKSGEIKTRDRIFVKQKHTFFSKKIKSVEEILSQLDMTDFTKHNITFLKINNSGNAVFRIDNAVKIKNSHVLALLYLTSENGEACFNLTITNTHNCEPSIIENPYNILLTRVERAIKALDSDVEVRRTAIEFVNK